MMMIITTNSHGVDQHGDQMATQDKECEGPKPLKQNVFLQPCRVDANPMPCIGLLSY